MIAGSLGSMIGGSVQMSSNVELSRLLCSYTDTLLNIGIAGVRVRVRVECMKPDRFRSLCRESGQLHNISLRKPIPRDKWIHIINFSNPKKILQRQSTSKSTIYRCRFETQRKLYLHYNDVIMTTMASQITSLTVVYSIVYSDADQRKHQSSASLAFVRGSHRDRWIPRTKGQ